MYYRLRDNYILRGWQKLSSGIVDLNKGLIGFLPLDYYRLLKLCDGSFNFDSFYMTDKDRALAAELAVRGFVDVSSSQLPSLDKFQEYRIYDNRFIRSIQWSITGKCNYKCKHCYMSAPHNILGEPSIEECRDIIDQISDCGIFNVQLTGGEALVHPHFWEIVDYLLEKKITISKVYSNGFLINNETLERFEARGIKPSISLSFDGTEGWHEWLRNVKGADEHIIRAFKLCQEKGFSTDAEMCIHKGNLHTIRDSVNLLASLGCSAIKINRLRFEGEALHIADKCISLEERNDAYLEYLPKYFEDGKPLAIILSNMFYSDGKKTFDLPSCSLAEKTGEMDFERYCLCGHARSSMYLTSEGHMLPCIPFSNSLEACQRFEKISDVPLKKALNDSFYFTCITTTMREYLERNPECRICEYLPQCKGGCRGLAIETYSCFDLLGRDPDTCLLFKKGYYDKVMDLIKRYSNEKQHTDN